MADYPSSIFEQRELENVSDQTFDATKKTRIYAEDLINLAAEISAIETVLGTDPNGAYDTVREWLEALVGGGGSFDPTKIKYGLVPSGTIDGSNKVFTLPNAIVANKLAVFLDGIRVAESTDWSYNSGTREITTVQAPQNSVLCDLIES